MIVAALLTAPQPTDAELARWSNNGPYGGYPRALAVSPHNPKVVLAATTHGMFRSTDRGDRWAPSSTGLGNVHLTDVMFHPGKLDVAYVATFGGIYRSDDAGRSWRRMDGVSSYGVAVTNTGVVFAESYDTLRVSLDSGATWKTIFDADSDHPITEWAAAPSDARIIYLSTYSHITGSTGALLRSADGGTTWRSTTSTGAWDLVVDPNDPDVVYAATAQGTMEVSRDGGQTWSLLWSHSAQFASDIAVSPVSPLTLFVTGGAGSGRFVARSLDGGVSWQQTQVAGLQEGPELEADPTNALIVYFGGRGDGVYRSIDGGATFLHRNHGLTAQPAWAVGTDPVDADVLYASLGTGGMFRSGDAGQSWIDLTRAVGDPTDPYLLPEVVSIAVAADGDVYAARQMPGWQGDTIVSSSDGGLTWTLRDNGLPQEDSVSWRPVVVVAHPTKPDRLIASFTANVADHDVGRTFLTEDGGETWTRIPNMDGEVRSIHVDPRTARVLIATGRDGCCGSDKQLFSSRDFGRTLTRLNYPNKLLDVGAVVYDPRKDRIYAGSGTLPSFAFSDDNAETWKRVDPPASSYFDVTVMAVDPLDPMQVFAGTDREGTWMSRDAGRTWNPLTPGVHGAEVRALAFSQPPSENSDAIMMRHRPGFVGMANRSKSGLVRMVPQPHNRRIPALSGTARVGRRLYCDPGRWSRATRYVYRWRRQGERIPGATAPSYLLVRADRTHRVKCQIIAYGPGGSDRATSTGVLIR